MGEIVKCVVLFEEDILREGQEDLGQIVKVVYGRHLVETVVEQD